MTIDGVASSLCPARQKGGAGPGRVTGGADRLASMLVAGALAGALAVTLAVAVPACTHDDGPPPAGSSTIRAGGLAWHTVARGPSATRAKRTVLFLHGGSYTSQIWVDRGILDDVAAKGYRAVAVDLPGHGDTPASDEPKAALLASLIAAVAAPGQVVVVSPSASGAYSLALLQDRPEVRLAGFVPVAPVGIDGFRRPPSAPPVPTLIVWGADDDVIAFANARVLADQLTASTIERIAGAGHAAYDDRPDAFTSLLVRFLDQRVS